MGGPKTPSTLVMDWVRVPARWVTTAFVTSKVKVPVKMVSLGCVIGSWKVSTTV